MSLPPNEGLFRKVALERLSSPDRLDALLGLNRPQWPLVWAGCVVVAAATLYWGLQGRVAQKVAGRCVITSPGGVAEIAAGAAGQVANLGLKVGDRVSVGQEVARVLRPELYQQIEQAAERLTELERRLAEAGRLARLSGEQGQGALAAERAGLEAQARLAGERAAAFERRLGSERGLLSQGLITRQALLDTEEALSGAVLERERLRDRAKQLHLQNAEEARQRNREQVSLQFQVNETRRSLEALRDIERQTAPVVSPYAGRVIEVKAQNGSNVAYGGTLLQIERSSEAGASAASLEAAIYISSGEGKLLVSGMAVEIVPDHVKRQEHGFMRARVEQVSEYPASLSGMRLLVQNDNLLKELSGQRAAIFARASFDRRPDGGFVWSASTQRPPAVRSGSLCKAEITVAERRPLALLLPALRRWFGLS